MASVVRFEFRWIFDRFSNKWSYFSYSLIHHNHVTHNVCIMATDRFTHCDQWSYCTDFVSWTMTFIHTCMHLVQTKHFAVAVLCLCVCVCLSVFFTLHLFHIGSTMWKCPIQLTEQHSLNDCWIKVECMTMTVEICIFLDARFQAGDLIFGEQKEKRNMLFLIGVVDFPSRIVFRSNFRTIQGIWKVKKWLFSDFLWKFFLTKIEHF